MDSADEWVERITRQIAEAEALAADLERAGWGLRALVGVLAAICLLKAQRDAIANWRQAPSGVSHEEARTRMGRGQP